MASPSPPTGAPPPSSSTPQAPPIASSSPPPVPSSPSPVIPPVPSPPVPSPPPVVSSSPPPTILPPVVPATPPPASPLLPPPPQSPPSPPIPPIPQPPPSPLIVPRPPITPPTVTSPPPSPGTPLTPPSSNSPPQTPPIQSGNPPPNVQPPQDAPPVSSPQPIIRLSPPPPVTSTDPLPVSPTVPSTPNSPNSPTPTSSSDAPPVTVSNNNSNRGLSTEVFVGIGAAVVIFVFLGAFVIWFLKNKKKDKRRYGNEYRIPLSIESSHNSEATNQSTALGKSSSIQGYSHSPKEPGPGISKGWFTYEELSEITDGFSSKNILGEGGFGCVYKGHLPDGRDVAVKQLKVGGGQGEREFQAEVEIISRVHHRHLVSLVGYCISENQRLLAYEFVPNNTLYHHLHGDEGSSMDWATRIKIAAGAARGIAYLHEDCHPRIIHRDIKSSNILLDNNFEALVSDFGLAKLTVDAQTHVTTRVMGTFGYMAPEYASSGKLTDRSDVFSFGVVLLELITGGKPVDKSRPLGDESLVQWARPLMSRALETGNFDGLPDPKLQGKYSEHEMLRMIETAAVCVRHSASMRPRMGVVMRVLDNLNDNLDLQNGVVPGQSVLFNAGPNSEDVRIFNMMARCGKANNSDFGNSSWSDDPEF